MTYPPSPVPPPAAPFPHDAVRSTSLPPAARVIGLLLVLPAGLLCLAGYVVPTLWTVDQLLPRPRVRR